MEYFVVGEIRNTHGLRGELKIKNLSDFDRFKKGAVLYIYKDKYIKVVVNTKRYVSDNLLVSFNDLLDINLVLPFKGCFIYIEKNDMGPLPTDEYYYHDLIGKNIVNEKGIVRGKVTSVRELPQGHMLVVLVNDKNKLIPFNKEFVIDVCEESITIKEMEGLL